MSYGESERLETAIRRLTEDAQSSELSDENRARLALLMTVWASGYLEVECRDIVTAYVKQRAQPNVVNYVARQLNRFNNPKVDRILELVGGFDREAEEELKRFADGKLKESVNSIIGLRNQIAHGRSTPISMARITEYYEDARTFTKEIRRVLGT